MHDHPRPRSFACLLISMLLACGAARAADTPSAPTCDTRQAFGIPFGPMPQALRRAATPVDLHDPPGFVSPMTVYQVRTAHGDIRFEHFDVAINRATGEIFQVIAYGPAFDPGDETHYDERVVPRLRPLAMAFAQENGLSLSTDGRPPYNATNEDVEIFVGHDYRNDRLRFTYTCTNIPAQRRYERDALHDLFRQTGNAPGTPSRPWPSARRTP